MTYPLAVIGVLAAGWIGAPLVRTWWSARHAGLSAYGRALESLRQVFVTEAPGDRRRWR